MTDREIIETLNKAAESVKDNIALSVLLIMAAERIQELSEGSHDER